MDKKELTVIILGAAGMLGHMLSLVLMRAGIYNVIPCARSKTGLPEIDSKMVFLNISEENLDFSIIEKYQPDVVINCIAILGSTKKMTKKEYWINAEYPLLLAEYIDRYLPSTRLIHISTDGVFSGLRGDYSEKDLPDPIDDYGRSKYEGEIARHPHCTIRTSIIGPDLNSSRSLFEWIMIQKGIVNGYSNVFWNGLTTLEFAKCIKLLIDSKISGIIHAHGEKVSKQQLLEKIINIFMLDCRIIAVDSPKINRTLTTVRTDISFQVSNVEEMLTDLKRWKQT